MSSFAPGTLGRGFWKSPGASSGTGGVVDLSSYTSIVSYYDADSTDNAVVQVNQTFSTSDVDTVGNKITTITVPFTAQSQGATGYFTPVYFSSTGTLPAPLTANTPYYLEPVTGGYRIYPLAKKTGWANILGGVDGDIVYRGQYPAQDVNPIVLTSTGSGTHTISTNPLLSRFKDLTGRGFDFLNSTTTSYGELFELIQDGSGKFVHGPGPQQIHYNLLGHNAYGKVMTTAGGTTERDAFRDYFSNQTYIYQVTALRPKRYEIGPQTLQITISNSSINTGTGVITYTSHPFATGNLVKFYTISGNTLPTPSTGAITDDFYIRNVSSSTFTLHPTSADASANTNKITFSSAGSGSFQVAAVRRLQAITGSLYTIDLMQPAENNHHNGNLIFQNFAGSSAVKKKVAFQTGVNGRIDLAGQTKQLAQVIFVAAPRAVLPTTSDRSASLNSKDTITAITKANPCVITVSATPQVASGDTVYLDNIVGMEELNGNTYAISVSGNDITLTGVNSTNYGTYTSGGFVQPVYFLTRSTTNPTTQVRLHRTLSEATSMQATTDASGSLARVQFTNYSTYSEMDAQDECRAYYVGGKTNTGVGQNLKMADTHLTFGELVVVTTRIECTPALESQRTITGVTVATDATGLITKSNHLFSTGDTAIGNANGGTLPTGMPTGISGSPLVGWVRNVSSSTFTLHPTKTDATNNTNVITYSTTGSGSWEMWRICQKASIRVNGGSWESYLDQFEPWAALAPTVSSSLSSLLLGNAGEPHVPGSWEIGALAVGTGTNGTTVNNDITGIENAFKTKYGIV